MHNRSAAQHLLAYVRRWFPAQNEWVCRTPWFSSCSGADRLGGPETSFHAPGFWLFEVSAVGPSVSALSVSRRPHYCPPAPHSPCVLGSTRRPASCSWDTTLSLLGEGHHVLLGESPASLLPLVVGVSVFPFLSYSLTCFDAVSDSGSACLSSFRGLLLPLPPEGRSQAWESTLLVPFSVFAPCFPSPKSPKEDFYLVNFSRLEAFLFKARASLYTPLG